MRVYGLHVCWPVISSVIDLGNYAKDPLHYLVVVILQASTRSNFRRYGVLTVVQCTFGFNITAEGYICMAMHSKYYIRIKLVSVLRRFVFLRRHSVRNLLINAVT